MTSKTALKFILPILIVVIGFGAFVSLRATGPIVSPKPSAEKVWPVSAMELTVGKIRPLIKEFGTIVAGNQADLRPLVAGRIIEVGTNYFEGAVIKKGELLVKIDPFDYIIDVADRNAALSEVLTRISEAVAEIGSETKLLSLSKSQLTLRERDLNRRRKLTKQGSGSRKSLDDSEIAFNDAAKSVALRQQTILRLRNRVDQYQASAERARSRLRLAERHLEETKLVAPFDGFLANAEASIGQRVGNADRLARLIEADRLEVRFRLSERDFGALLDMDNRVSSADDASSELIGKSISVEWRVGDRGLEFKAMVERLGAEIDASSGGVDVYARLLDINNNTSLRPGAFVEVAIPARLYKDVIKVPGAAVINGSNIYLIEGGRLIYRTIEVVRRGGDWILIRGNSLDGLKMVTRPFPEMASGLRVDPQ